MSVIDGKMTKNQAVKAIDSALNSVYTAYSTRTDTAVITRAYPCDLTPAKGDSLYTVTSKFSNEINRLTDIITGAGGTVSLSTSKDTMVYGILTKISYNIDALNNGISSIQAASTTTPDKRQCVLDSAGARISTPDWLNYGTNPSKDRTNYTNTDTLYFSALNSSKILVFTQGKYDYRFTEDRDIALDSKAEKVNPIVYVAEYNSGKVTYNACSYPYPVGDFFGSPSNWHGLKMPHDIKPDSNVYYPPYWWRTDEKQMYKLVGSNYEKCIALFLGEREAYRSPVAMNYNLVGE